MRIVIFAEEPVCISQTIIRSFRGQSAIRFGASSGLADALFRFFVWIKTGSCPLAWCSLVGLIATLAGKGWIGQAAPAGSPTTGSSLKGAMVSSVM